MSDLGRNIRLIAGSEELEQKIRDLQAQLDKDSSDKNPIDGSRSTAYKTYNGGYGQKSGDSGIDQILDDVASGLDDLTDEFIDIFSDESGNQGGTGEEGTPNQLDNFTKELQDLFDQAPTIGDQILQLTGLEDCNTGDEGQIQMDGFFIPELLTGIEDLGGTTSNGENTTNPRDEGFVEGSYYSIAGVSDAYSPYASSEIHIGLLNGIDPGNTHIISSVYPNTGIPGQYLLDVHRTLTAPPNTVTFLIGITINVTSGCTVDVDSFCPSAVTLIQWSWTSDGVHQLAFDGAQFKTSDFEPLGDIVNEWGDNTSSISGCTTGGDGVTITPSGDGGSLITFDNGNQIEMSNGNIVLNVNY